MNIDIPKMYVWNIKWSVEVRTYVLPFFVGLFLHFGNVGSVIWWPGMQLHLNTYQASLLQTPPINKLNIKL